MGDDRLIRANERELFEAIISQLVDPELVRTRRAFLLMSVSLFILGSLGLAVAGGLGLVGLCAFSSTFVPGLALSWTVYARRFSRR